MYYNENGDFNGDALIGEIRHGQSSICLAHSDYSLLPP